MNHRYTILLPGIILLIIACNFSNPLERYSDKEYISLLCVERDGKFGFIDEYGVEIIPCKYDYPSIFSEGLAALKKGKNWSYYNTRGKKVMDLKNRFTYCGAFHDGAAFVSTRPLSDELPIYASFWENMCDEIQYIDKNGEVLFKVKNEWGVKCKGAFRRGFSDGLLKMTVKNDPPKPRTQVGYLDKSGQLKIPFKFRAESNSDETFSDGLAGMGLREYLPDVEKPIFNYGYINKSGEWQIPPAYRKVYPFMFGAALVSDTLPNSFARRIYLIDTLGNRVFPPDVESYARLQRDSLLAVFKVERSERGTERLHTRRYAIAKTDGTLITDFKFSKLHPGDSAQDLWTAQLPGDDKSIGFVNDQGSVVIPYQYPGCKYHFENGMAVVYTKEKLQGQAVINKKGEFVIPPDSIENLQVGGIIMCPSLDDSIRYYNRSGQLIDFGEYVKYGIFQHLPLAEL